MPVSDPSPVSAEELPGDLIAMEETTPGLWPGLAPLNCEDVERFGGRERELERLVRLFKRPKSGQTPMVWLGGDAGVGKTSLVLAGLISRLGEDTEEIFEWFRVTPDPGAGPQEMIELVVAEILQRTASEDDEGGLDLEGRLRQFGLLMDQDGAEAVDYLASCYRKVAEGNPDRSGEKSSSCLIFIDQWDRLKVSGGSLSERDEALVSAEIEPLVSFLHQLSFAGCFPCLVAVRSLNFPAIKAAAENAGCGDFGSEIQIGPLDLSAVRAFFESAPSPGIDSGRTRVSEELLELLTSGEGESAPGGALPFVSETLKRLSASDPLAEEIGLEDERWAGGVRQTFSEVAESVVSSLPERRKSFFGLMAALHPSGLYTGATRDKLRTESISARYFTLISDPEMSRLVDALIDARVLSLNGATPDKARVSWSLPDAILQWKRAFQWLEENDRLHARAGEFDQRREEWESERRTSVKLLHSTRSIADAGELLDYHRRRTILSEELTAFLEESVSFDECLGANWRKRRWIQLGLIAGGVLLVVATVIFLAVS